MTKQKKYYNLSIERQPNQISNYLQMATLLSNEAKYSESFKYFEAAKDIKTDCIAIYLLWSSCLLLNRQYDFAEYRINECLKLCQNNKQMSMDAMYLSAMIKLERGQYKVAESSFKALIRQYPEFSDAHCFYAACLADLRKKEVAEKHWEDAINLNQHNLSAHYFYGIWLFYNGETNKSVFHLKECLRINEKHCNSRYILASIYFQRRQWKESEKHFLTIDKQIIASNANYKLSKTNQIMIYYKNYADVLIQIGEKQGAVQKYTKSLYLLKALKTQYIKKYNLKQSATQYSECRCKYFLNAPNQENLYDFYNAFECDTREKLATCLSRCKELKTAFVECEKCLKLCPNHIEAIFRFASILSNLKKYKKAEKFFKKCLEQKPNHGKAFNNFGVMRLNVGKYDEAMHFFKKAQYVLKHQPNALREVQKNIDLCSRKKMESIKNNNKNQNDEDHAAANKEKEEEEKKKNNGHYQNIKHGKKGKSTKGKKTKR